MSSSIFTDRNLAATYYANRGDRRFYVFGLNQSELREWQVREDHEWLGIEGGSGLISSHKDRVSASAEADRLNELDTMALVPTRQCSRCGIDSDDPRKDTACAGPQASPYHLFTVTK